MDNPRTRLLTAALTAATALTPAGAALAQSDAGKTATGRVFLDGNRNGELDQGEQGVEGVAVSNGLEVVTTDEDGRYSLAVDGQTIIRMTKPAGYAVPTNESELPQFYYIHDPDGSPHDLRYPGVQPTGSLPDQINFPLHEAEKTESFEAILISDPQPQSGREIDYIRDDVVSELIGTDAKFGMTTGDIMFDDLSLLPRYNAVIGQIGVPWWNVPGNHEMNFQASGDKHATETFKRVYGPTYYSFEYGAAHFISLDNVDYQGKNVGREEPRYRGGGVYEGRISNRQLEWLKNDLALVLKDELVFLAMHIPLKTYLGDGANVNTVNRRELFDIIEDYPNLYAVAGHTHTSEHHYFDEDDGFDGKKPFHHHVLSTVSGSWWSGPKDARGIPDAVQRDGTPNGYHVLEVDGTNVEVRFKAANKPADHQMRVMFDTAHHTHNAHIYGDYDMGELLDGDMTADKVPAASLLVNLFDGGRRSHVEFKVAGGGWRDMTHVRQMDLHANELFQRNAGTVKPWVEAEPSSHIWKADLPDEIGPGTYTVTVRATDEFGNTHHAHKVLEVRGTGLEQSLNAGDGKT
ncbi:hypothetical protein CKO28_26365 [Rhodovibrio sodomensis]|uniref:Cna protein B-type domain containing protein n=1 Tax=Rhodovibrio sodomensis TaxID=1088 RepID=A0ABS1DNN2_9PROT|nr:calcineurin-like phosphoesterase family protein [Rhodovibrio sodomensis]MBK1671527.1 hypothetical protein [Rhodovibrio sodomensis]